ncbi:MAG TPA: calcium-binding protein [Spirochaetia bacterium]|nr:calcium-binding protein [Spirochaetia bacterium]
MKVYTFNVYLGGVPKKRPDPPWRKIEIAGSRTLDDLHEAIFDAFDRQDDTHLYAFFLGGGKSKSGRDRYEGIKYTSPEGMTSGKERNSAETAIDFLSLQVGNYLRYLFKSGVEWWHVVELTGIEERADGSLKYPRVVEKHGESPDPEGWVEYLSSALIFPFEAEVSEYQDEGPLQIGDRLVVKKVVDEDDKYGVMVEARVGRRKFQFPLIDLELVDKNSPNQGPIDEYRAWFPGEDW